MGGIDPRSVHGKTVSVAAETDLLVIGGGPAGVAAAIDGARLGQQVVLVDEHPLDPALFGMDVPHWFGGRHGREVHSTRTLAEQMAADYEEAYEAGIEVVLSTAVLGLYVNGPAMRWLPGHVAVLHTRNETWGVRFRKAIVAAGCRDLAVAFPGWDTPGVMGAAAAELLVRRYAALDVRSAVVLGSGVEALLIVREAQALGIRVDAVIEAAHEPRGGEAFAAEMRARGVPILFGQAPRALRTDAAGVSAVQIGPAGRAGERWIICDTVICAVGSVPNIELLAAAGADIVHDPGSGGYVPRLSEAGETSLYGLYAVGDGAGLSGGKLADPSIAREEGRTAARHAAGAAAHRQVARSSGARAYDSAALTPWIEAIGASDLLICQCEGVTARDVAELDPPDYVHPRPTRPTDIVRAAGTGALVQDQVKRLTRAGMGLCQGRRCREQVGAILAGRLGCPTAEGGLATYRAPVRPVPLSALAEREEPGEMASNWVSWFGIPDQYKPFWEMLPAISGPGCRTGAQLERGATVVVVGGGVTGLSAAWWLAREGFAPLVLEAGFLGDEASGRNGGGSGAFHSPLFPEAERLWPQMNELLGYPTEFRPGRLKIARTEAQLAALGSSVAAARHIGCQVDRLAAAEVAELAPLAGSEGLGGFLFRAGGHMNPQRALQAFAWAVEDLGGRVMQRAKVTSFRSLGGRVVEVGTDRGAFGCDAVLIAAGTRTGLVAGWLGATVPVAAARAEIVLTEPLAPMPFTNVDGNGLYGRQTWRGNLAYGGGPHEWLDGVPGAAMPRSGSPLIRSIAKRMAELLPKAAHARVIRSWAGFIECTPDGRPIIDRLPGVDNVVVATMSSVGFGLSPASGRAIMEILRDGRCGFADLGSFALSRFDDLRPDWRAVKGWLPSPGGVIAEADRMPATAGA